MVIAALVAQVLIFLLSWSLYAIGVRRGHRMAARRRSFASRAAVRRTQQRLVAAYEEAEDDRNEALGEFCQGVHDAAISATHGCPRCSARFDAAWATSTADDLDEFIVRSARRQN